MGLKYASLDENRITERPSLVTFYKGCSPCQLILAAAFFNNDPKYG
jgi:hypothetical protein